MKGSPSRGKAAKVKAAAQGEGRPRKGDAGAHGGGEMLWAPHPGHNKRTSQVSENRYFLACWALANNLGYSFMLCCTD